MVDLGSRNAWQLVATREATNDHSQAFQIQLVTLLSEKVESIHIEKFDGNLKFREVERLNKQ